MKLNDFKFDKKEDTTLGKLLELIIIVAVAIAIQYGATLLCTALGLWALVQLGEIESWTWKQAALISILLCIVSSFTSTSRTVRVSKNKD